MAASRRGLLARIALYALALVLLVALQIVRTRLEQAVEVHALVRQPVADPAGIELIARDARSPCAPGRAHYRHQ